MTTNRSSLIPPAPWDAGQIDEIYQIIKTVITTVVDVFGLWEDFWQLRIYELLFDGGFWLMGSSGLMLTEAESEYRFMMVSVVAGAPVCGA